MFQGVLTALVTPFENGRLDEERFRNLIEEQLSAGVDGLVPVGTTGESPTLSMEEHIRAIDVCVKATNKRVPVLAGAGANSTAEAIELSKAAKSAGADGLLQVTPYYNRPTQEGLLEHFRMVLKAAPLPTVLYNVPARTGCDLLPETVAKLADLPEIIGIKEATGNPVRGQQILARAGDRITLLSGDDLTALSLYAIGARGVISVTSNVAPGDVSALWKAVLANDYARARSLHYKLLPLSDLLFIEANPIPVKAALAMMGKILPEVRLPLVPMTRKNQESLRVVLATMGLL